MLCCFRVVPAGWWPSAQPDVVVRSFLHNLPPLVRAMLPCLRIVVEFPAVFWVGGDEGPHRIARLLQSASNSTARNPQAQL